MKKHIGFKHVAKTIAKKEGVSVKSASAIVASASRNASGNAKRINTHLRKVK
jgi:hypothetical protein